MHKHHLPDRIVALTLAAFLAFTSGAVAQEGGRPHPAAPAPAAADAHRTPLPADAVTQHEITIAGTKLAYTATAGTLALSDDKGEAKADIFYVSFVLAPGAETANRPITYLFNGGPGASSAYLDIGAVGPRTLVFGAGGEMPAAPGVADNPDTWLPFTDLVFIDPVGTGWSRATGADDATAKEFYGVDQDLDALADIIRLHLTKSGRLTSPVYLAGESYGGFRAARLAHELATEHGIAPAGVTMISPVIDFGLMSSNPLDPVPWALRLPSYAAAKLGVKAIDPGALADAESFALGDYLSALVAGTRDGAAANAVYARLAQFTGLDLDRIAQWHGLIPLDDYIRELRRRDGRIVSRYDATASATDPSPWSGGGRDDPVLDGTIAPFTTAFVAYARDELGFATDRRFELLNHDVSRHWDWHGGRGPFRSLSANDALQQALALSPRLKVLIAHGVADLETPYMMSRYIKDHMPAPLGDRIALKLYAGGHMLYLHSDSRRRLHDDVQAFYATSPAE